MQKRNINPTKFLPLWDLLGVGLGFGTAMLGKKATMLCTASVEEVIDEHYKNQTYRLKEDEKSLKEKIVKFRNTWKELSKITNINIERLKNDYINSNIFYQELKNFDIFFI